MSKASRPATREDSKGETAEDDCEAFRVRESGTALTGSELADAGPIELSQGAVPEIPNHSRLAYGLHLNSWKETFATRIRPLKNRILYR